MKIILTGASSFTGFWFASELARQGHAVTATLRSADGRYADDVRNRRVARLAEVCRVVHGVCFGDERFLNLVGEGGWDVLCHHAADVANYRSPDFDVNAAVANNTRKLATVLKSLREGGCLRVLLTGTVFESGEGAGSEGLPAFSPYGLSKALTARFFEYYVQRAGMHLGKFVIPNPFGPFEEPRFTAYLMKNWFAGARPSVNTPAYVRDNIHVSLLARAYVRFAEQLPASAGLSRINPSGYVESQGAFAMRFAAEMRARLGLACELELKRQTDFSEPRVRINTDQLDAASLRWDESAAWDEIASYYREAMGR